MKHQFFTIPVFAPEQGQNALNQFCSQHQVVSVEKQFVDHGLNSSWSICVSYTDGNERLPELSQNNHRERIDYREKLNPQDFAIYASLRELRKRLAKEDNVPAYAIFNNEQLAEIVTARAGSLDALGKIDGVGKARLDKYGEAFVTELQRLLAELPDNSNETPTSSAD